MACTALLQWTIKLRERRIASPVLPAECSPVFRCVRLYHEPNSSFIHSGYSFVPSFIPLWSVRSIQFKHTGNASLSLPWSRLQTLLAQGLRGRIRGLSGGSEITHLRVCMALSGGVRIIKRACCRLLWCTVVSSLTTALIASIWKEGVFYTMWEVRYT